MGTEVKGPFSRWLCAVGTYILADSACLWNCRARLGKVRFLLIKKKERCLDIPYTQRWAEPITKLNMCVGVWYSNSGFFSVSWFVLSIPVTVFIYEKGKYWTAKYHQAEWDANNIACLLACLEHLRGQTMGQISCWLVLIYALHSREGEATSFGAQAK